MIDPLYIRDHIEIVRTDGTVSLTVRDDGAFAGDLPAGVGNGLRGLTERLAAEGQLMAYRHEGFFYAMDTYREYQHLNELWDSGRPPWKVWE